MKDFLRLYLGDRIFFRRMLALGLPIALQNLLSSSLSIIDTIMIGRLGEVSLSAVSLAGQWAFLLNLMIFGFASGTAVFLSQYWGIKDMPNIQRTFGLGVFNALFVSVVFMVLGASIPEKIMALYTDDPEVIALGTQYLSIAAYAYPLFAVNTLISTLLRSTENVRLPLVSSVCAVGMNTLLNWSMIYGKLGFSAMGVRGAAVATVIATLICTVLLLVISVVKKNVLRMPFGRMFNFDGPFVKKFYVIAMPVVANETLWALGMSITNAVLGRQGTSNYAAYTVCNNAGNLVFVFFVGLCSSCAVMVGKFIGAGDKEGGFRDARRFGILVPLLAVVLGTVLICCRDPLLKLYSMSEDGYAMARNILLLYGCNLPLSMFNYVVICGIYRSGGDTKTGLYLDLGCMYLITVPLVTLMGMVLHGPFLLVYGMILVENVPKLILGVRHLVSGKWIKPITEEGKKAMQEAI